MLPMLNKVTKTLSSTPLAGICVLCLPRVYLQTTKMKDFSHFLSDVVVYFFSYCFSVCWNSEGHTLTHKSVSSKHSITSFLYPLLSKIETPSFLTFLKKIPAHILIYYSISIIYSFPYAHAFLYGYACGEGKPPLYMLVVDIKYLPQAISILFLL